MTHPKTGHSFVVLLMAMVIAVPVAAAGEGPAIEPGARVRVTASAPGHFQGVAVGTLTDINSTSVTIVDSERGSITQLPLESIKRLEVSQGRHRHTRMGLLIGGAFGLALVPLVLSADCRGTDWEPRTCNKDETAALAVANFAVFGGIGALIGHSRQTEAWTETPVQRLRMTVRPLRGGGRVALTLTF